MDFTYLGSESFLLHLPSGRLLLVDTSAFVRETAKAGHPSAKRHHPATDRAAEKADVERQLSSYLADVKWESVEAIILTNYQQFYSLPLITEGTTFNGRIYATEPTLVMGKQLLFDALHGHDFMRKQEVDTETRMQRYEPHTVGSRYDRMDVERCLCKVDCISYGEEVRLSDGEVIATLISSGYTLGAGNLLLRVPKWSDFEMTIVSASYWYGAKKGKRHPTGFSGKPLKSSKYSIVSGLRMDEAPVKSEGETAPVSTEFSASVTDVLKLVSDCTSKNNAAIILCDPAGTVLYDILEPICASTADSVPVFFVSYSALESMNYAEVSAEWVTQKRSEMTTAEPSKVHSPFYFTDYISQSKLLPLKHLHTPKALRTLYGTASCGDRLSNGCVLVCSERGALCIDVVETVLGAMKAVEEGGRDRREVEVISVDSLYGLTTYKQNRESFLSNIQEKYGVKVHRAELDPRLNISDFHRLIDELGDAHGIFVANPTADLQIAERLKVSKRITPMNPKAFVQLKDCVHHTTETGVLNHSAISDAKDVFGPISLKYKWVEGEYMMQILPNAMLETDESSGQWLLNTESPPLRTVALPAIQTVDEIIASLQNAEMEVFVDESIRPEQVWPPTSPLSGSDSQRLFLPQLGEGVAIRITVEREREREGEREGEREVVKEIVVECTDPKAARRVVEVLCK